MVGGFLKIAALTGIKVNLPRKDYTRSAHLGQRQVCGITHVANLSIKKDKRPPSPRAVDGAENEQNAIRILGYFRANLGYFAEKSWLFCRPARSTTATATPHGQEIGFFLPRKIQK